LGRPDRSRELSDRYRVLVNQGVEDPRHTPGLPQQRHAIRVFAPLGHAQLFDQRIATADRLVERSTIRHNDRRLELDLRRSLSHVRSGDFD
jgi:hypothetical protein